MSLTWLHISDFHIRSGDPYDRNLVLRALVESVADYAKRGRTPDLIFATGDIAHSGKSEEYALAGKFFDELLRTVRLDKNRLFIIPGNHDVDRDFGVGLARTLDSREEADAYFRPDRPKPHLVLKLRAFLDWHNRYFEGVRVGPDHSTCGPVLTVDINGHRLGILPMNSALFCQGDDDHDKLWIGRRCLDAAIAELQALQNELNIVLIHHPLEWLSSTEGSNIQAALETSAHILLRGHLHETRIESVASAEGELLRCAAGAAYQTRKWANRALYATFQGGRLKIYPIRYEDAPRPTWTTDPSVFPHDDNHERSFAVPRLSRERIAPTSAASARRDSTPPRFRSNIGSRGNTPFVGRDDLIARIVGTLGDSATGESVVVLHGQPGVGKSELAREFARQHREHYGGGTFWVDASTDSIAIHLASIGKTILDLDFPADLPLDEQGQKTFYSLGAAPVLLIYDNVVSFERIERWLPLSGMPCHILITTLVDTQSLAWPRIEVNPLSSNQSLELVEKLADAEFAASYGEAIAAHAGGLPVQIVPETAALAYERRRGRSPSAISGVARVAGDSFRTAYERLDQPSRLLLHTAAILNPQRIPAAELSRHLHEGIGWSDADFRRALDACLDLHILNGAPEPSLHQLFAAFLRETALSADDNAALSQIRAAQKGRLVEVAEAVSANPADTQAATTLISYPITPEVWEGVGRSLSIEEGSVIGRALYEIGRFAEARPWFERAVAEKEKGDAHGRIDHESLSSSLHSVGYCLSSTGQYAEARSWYERAVAEKEKGDVHGRIDHASLGRSLHEVGYCLSRTGQYAEARPWYERAVAETEKGDVHGRIDHESLGSSLHSVGYCLASTGQDAEARPWYERAVAEKEKGDVHGRSDHASLGRSLHQVGYCLSRTGQYAEARPWYERAVAEKEKGDVHGRIDHGSLGLSLHQVGYCLSSTGQDGEARPWYERAVAEAEKGDVHGRIDHVSLGRSLHQVGSCLSRAGQDGEARPWYERAVAEAEKGDVHGRIDHASLGRSLHEVGYCLSSTGQYAEARPWYERAVAEKERGDLYGRIDHASLCDTLRAGAACLRELGQIKLAGEWEQKALDWEQSSGSISGAD